MKKEEKKENQKKNNCPLCDVSEETLEKLKEFGKKNKDKAVKKNNE